MENTVITQPQGSNKKKLVIGGVIAVAVIGVGVYMFMGNSKTMYKGALTPGAQVDLAALPERNVADQAALPDLPAEEPAAVVEEVVPVVAQPVLNPDAVAAVLPGNAVDCAADAADGEPEVFVAGRGCVSVSQLAAERIVAQPVLDPDAVAAVVPGNQDQQVAAPAVQNTDGGLAATPAALAAPQAVNSGLAALPIAPVEEDAPVAQANDNGKISINASALKNAKVIANPNIIKSRQEPAVAVAQPVVDNFGNANSYPEQPETLKRIKELEDALAAQDRARAAASAYGDNNNQMTPEQAAAQANRLAQEAAEARVAQADAMRNAADQPIKKPLQGGVIDVDAIAQAEAANAALEASNSAGAATVTRTARVNAAGRTDATAAGRLHGAAIQGTSGPEVLLYPALIAAANGAYFSLRRRNKNK